MSVNIWQLEAVLLGFRLLVLVVLKADLHVYLEGLSTSTGQTRYTPWVSVSRFKLTFWNMLIVDYLVISLRQVIFF